MSLLTRRHCQAIMLLLASAGCAAPPPLPEPPPPVEQTVIVPEPPPPLVSYTIVAKLEAGLLPTVPEVPMRQPDLLSQFNRV